MDKLHRNAANSGLKQELYFATPRIDQVLVNGDKVENKSVQLTSIEWKCTKIRDEVKRIIEHLY